MGDAAERAERLFEAILRDDPEHARDFFFPLEPFLVLEGIADPERYWNVLWGHYERDIHALHGEVPEGATFERFVRTRRGRDGEREGRFEVRTLIDWGPRWYVTHLR